MHLLLTCLTTPQVLEDTLFFSLTTKLMIHVVHWKSVKLQRVVDDTLEAQSISLRSAVGAAIYLGHLLSEFYKDNFKNNLIPITAFTDNLSLESNVRSTKQVKAKRLRIDIAEIEEVLREKEIKELKWGESKDQLADGLTKRAVLVDRIMNIVENGNLCS
eukprot:gene10352-11428_t